MDNFDTTKWFKNQYMAELNSKLNENFLPSNEMEKEADIQKLISIINKVSGLEFDDRVRSSTSNGREGYYVRIAGRGRHYFEDEDILKLKKAFEEANKITDRFNYEYNNATDYETDIDDDRSWAASVSFFADEKSNKNKINEDRIDQSKMFDQSEVDEIIGEIREITGILEDKFEASVGYSEFRFSDGTGGFSFKWSHSRQMSGRFGLSLRSNGNHKLEAISRYSDKIFGSEDIKSKNTFVQNIETWRDLDNSMLTSIWAQLQPMVVKNEAAAEAALSAEAKAQRDYYSKKADTGRIGYGLSSQPRMRNESIEDIKDLEDRLAQLYREMEQDAEPEGGPISDQYADEIDKLESEIRSLKPKKPTLTYDQAVGKVPKDQFIKSKKYDRGGNRIDGEEKKSKFKKAGEESGFDMRGLKEGEWTYEFGELDEENEENKNMTKNPSPEYVSKILQIHGKSKEEADKIVKKLQSLKESNPDKAKKLEEKLAGLWDNIRAKRASGKKMSSKGSKAYKSAVKAGNRINKEDS